MGRGKGRLGEKVQEKRSINGRYKIHKGRLRILQEMEMPKNLYVQPMDMSQGLEGQGMLEGMGASGVVG